MTKGENKDGVSGEGGGSKGRCGCVTEGENKDRASEV